MSLFVCVSTCDDVGCEDVCVDVDGDVVGGGDVGVVMVWYGVVIIASNMVVGVAVGVDVGDGGGVTGVDDGAVCGGSVVGMKSVDEGG